MVMLGIKKFHQILRLRKNLTPNLGEFPRMMQYKSTCIRIFSENIKRMLPPIAFPSNFYALGPLMYEPQSTELKKVAGREGIHLSQHGHWFRVRSRGIDRYCC